MHAPVIGVLISFSSVRYEYGIIPGKKEQKQQKKTKQQQQHTHTHNITAPIALLLHDGTRNATVTVGICPLSSPIYLNGGGLSRVTNKITFGHQTFTFFSHQLVKAPVTAYEIFLYDGHHVLEATSGPRL